MSVDMTSTTFEVEQPCTCPRPHILRRRSLPDGTVQFQYQCGHCGRDCGIFRGVPAFPEKLPVWDEAAYQRYLAGARPGRDQWWSRYAAYMRSAAWQVKRRAVMEREQVAQQRLDPLCQACGERPGVQTHHLTYERLFKEPLFDLALVCDTCHRALDREPVDKELAAGAEGR